MKDDAFMAMFKMVMLFLVVIFVVILVLAKFITSGFYAEDAATAAAEDSAVAERIAPLAKVKEAGAAPAAGGAAAAMSGKDVFSAACFACHGTGAAGAPKIGDKAAWGPRIAQGNDTLYTHAINGFTGGSGVMPAKGGRADLSDDAVKAAVDYMVGESK